MLLRKTPLSKKLTSEEVEGKLKNVVRGETNQNIPFQMLLSVIITHTCAHSAHLLASGAQVCSEQGRVYEIPQDPPHSATDPRDVC